MSSTFSRWTRHAAVAGSVLVLGAAPASSAHAKGDVEAPGDVTPEQSELPLDLDAQVKVEPQNEVGARVDMTTKAPLATDEVALHAKVDTGKLLPEDIRRLLPSPPAVEEEEPRVEDPLDRKRPGTVTGPAELHSAQRAEEGRQADEGVATGPSRAPTGSSGTVRASAPEFSGSDPDSKPAGRTPRGSVSAAASGSAKDETEAMQASALGPASGGQPSPVAGAIRALFEFVPTSVKVLIAILAALASALAVTTLLNRRKLAAAESRAATDALTELPNHSSIRITLKEMLARASRAQTSLSVVLFDLDNFKQINDRYGHLKGDEVLVAIAGAARHGLRAGDFVGRYGGEEFVLLLPDTDESGGTIVAEKLRGLISTIVVPELEERITASFGLATFPDDGSDDSEVLGAADQALYAAKALGRDRVVAAAPAAELEPVAS